MTPQQFCHQVCKKSGSNFVYTFYLLGKKRRRALEAFYAFCRVVDDSVDQAANPEEAKQKLVFWKEEVEHLFKGNPRDPVSQALFPATQEYQIPKKYLEEIIAGCEMDLTHKTYTTFEELEGYCYRVASCVGLVCLSIFGVSPLETTKKGAISLGKALQLTNILRDIASDLGRERIYLPQEDLKRLGVTMTDLSQGTKDNLNLVDLLYFEIERTKTFFKEAWESFPKSGSDRRKLLAARLMGRIYEALLNKISRDPLAVFRGKVRVTNGEKLKIACKEICNLSLRA